MRYKNGTSETGQSPVHEAELMLASSHDAQPANGNREGLSADKLRAV